MNDNSLRGFYAAIAENYDNLLLNNELKDCVQREKDFLSEHIQDKTSMLDVGCGTGEHLLPILSKDCRLVGMDYCDKMLNQAEKKIGGKATLLLGDARELDFPENHFEYSIAFCSFGNIREYDKVFARMVKCSKEILLSIYKPEYIHSIVDMCKSNGWSVLKVENNELDTQEGFYYKFFTRGEVKELFKKHNLDYAEHDAGIARIYIGRKRTTIQ